MTVMSFLLMKMFLIRVLHGMILLETIQGGRILGIKSYPILERMSDYCQHIG